MTYSYRYRNAFQAARPWSCCCLMPEIPARSQSKSKAIVRRAIDIPTITEVQQRGRMKALSEKFRDMDS
jgi:hypothetical protein